MSPITLQIYAIHKKLRYQRGQHHTPGHIKILSS